GLKALLADVEDVRTAVPEGTLLLHMAEEAMGGERENEMAAFLVSKKAWTLQRDEKGRKADYLIYEYELFETPRQYALDALMKESADRYWKAIREDSVEDLKAVSDHVPMDRHVLYDALYRNKAVNVAVYAVEQGAPVNSVEPQGGNTPLHLLCNETPYTHPFNERLAAARAMTAAGADVNATNKQGETPLVTLVISKRKDNYNNMGSPVELAKILLQAGADPNALDQGGYSVLYTAANNRMDDLVALLLEYGVTLDDNALTKAYNMTDRTRQLFREKGADI
ncbi:MAG: hypothetical protein JW760_04230, partial [Spirochaetales bacterium]|nr:hypothetical protein [Spirochaetales bacterium]